MKTASVRDLRFSFAKIENLLLQGEEVQITKRERVVARLLPAAPTLLVKPDLPDFLGRVRAIYGDECLQVSGAALISKDRDEGIYL